MSWQPLRTISPEYAKALIRFLPSRPDYGTWINVISALGNTFDEITALNILLSHFHDEKKGEHQYKLHNRLPGVSFGSLIYLAKKFGYTQDERNKSYHSRKTFDSQSRVKSKPKPIYTFSTDKGIINRFSEYVIEERTCIYECDASMTRSQAEIEVLSDYPNSEFERVYRIAINNKILNKNLNPETKEPYNSYKAYTNCFKNKFLTIKEICDSIGQGFSICCCRLKEDSKGKILRNNESFLSSDLFAIDIDGSITIPQCLSMDETKRALILYTTASHTDQEHRFRLLFALPRNIDRADIFRTIVSRYISIYKADKLCADPVRGFFGNSNSTITMFQTGEILNFKEGILYE
jgi:hypothetical protein